MGKAVRALLLGVTLVTFGLGLAWVPLAPIFLGGVLMAAGLFYDFGETEDE